MAIPKKEAENAVAIHANDGETHIVGIGNLRVIVCNDNGHWFAQGLEIDYAADGKSFSEVKKNFESGLKATIGQHLQVYGDINKLLIPAPPEIWQELASIKKRMKFSQVTIHEEAGDADLSQLPYSGINFIEQTEKAAA